MAAKVSPSSWEDLPPVLLGGVLQCLPSLADRVRVRAVCRPWRAGAQPQRHSLPPPLPWLAFRDGSLVDLQGSPVHCPSILRKDALTEVFGYLAFDNLAFLVDHDGTCSLSNPITGETLPLTKLAPAVRRAIDGSRAYGRAYIQKGYVKAIISSPLDLMPDPLVAVLILEGYSLAISKQHDAVCISMPPELEKATGSAMIDDIAFLHGKLYALTPHEGLYLIELDASRLSELKSSSCFRQCIADDPKQQEIYSTNKHHPGSEYLVMRYLAESNGRLLLIRRWMFIPQNARLGDHDRTFRFEVFVADLATVPGRWTKVDSFGGQALFLGSECSKSVLASQCADGIEEDCIYFMHRVFDNPCREHFGPCADPLADSGVYNMRNGEFKPLVPDAVMAELKRKRQFLTWFFPADE
ncbi:hypothetical protein PR202_ga20748 [Eleusine coracana subsp. coracana]|uniref:KIB1-4 beta-propeller domain-containing protein n=1 Tax=Eleusine coracana subsp. coracana TaxID=191504 RepID=A0AAV5CZ19_ELECO|nr:hypothetical protein PR202_ga20748 [Eleusine coracana subsp. coracana]